MLNDEKQKNELILIDRKLRQIMDDLKKAERENNFDLFTQLIEEQLLLSFRKNQLGRNFSRPNTSDAVQCCIAPSARNEVKPNQYLIQLASFLFPDEMRETALGCIEERFHSNYAESNKKIKAHLYLLRDIIESSYPVLKDAIFKRVNLELSELNKNAFLIFGRAVILVGGNLTALIIILFISEILHKTTGSFYFSYYETEIYKEIAGFTVLVTFLILFVATVILVLSCFFNFLSSLFNLTQKWFLEGSKENRR